MYWLEMVTRIGRKQGHRWFAVYMHFQAYLLELVAHQRSLNTFAIFQEQVTWNAAIVNWLKDPPTS